VAQKKKAVSKATTGDATVVRIKATDTQPATTKKSAAKPENKAESTPVKSKKIAKPTAKGLARPFVATGAYFKGAWTELKQVRWPNRRATWSLTGAVLVYSAFFALLVLLLDSLFKYLFELMLGK
jgi:preprotein translocase SecE subunit